jgi:hypothetical protein
MRTRHDFWITQRDSKKKQEVVYPKVSSRGIQKRRKSLEQMVGAQGLEPETSCVKDRR